LVNFNINRLKEGKKATSLSTAAYCRAKSRLSKKSLMKIAIDVGRKIDEYAENWKNKERDIYFADGSIIQLQDTKQNRKKYPRIKYKGVEVGMPKFRVLALISATSGAFVDGVISGYSGKGQAETSSLLQLLDRIKKGSVIVLDRFFTSLSLQAILQDYGINYVIRGREKFVRKHLGRKNDKVITLKKKMPRSDCIYLGLDHHQYITLRLIKSSLKRKGFRTINLFILTSLLDEKREIIEQIYLKRWNVELDIRNIKTTMNSEQLRSKTPEGAEKEFWVRILAYNLTRFIMVQSSKFTNTGPRKRSFKTALNCCIELMKNNNKLFLESALKLLSTECLKSKYRREARAIKRRNYRYPFLTADRKKSLEQDWGYKRRRPNKKPSIDYGALNAMA